MSAQDLTELFAAPVEGNGLLGDVAISPDPHELIGQSVTAKRLGWDDGETAEDDPDHTPYSEMDYASPDLSGILALLRFTLPDRSPGEAWEVGGQPADPATIQAAAPDAKNIEKTQPEK